MANNSIGQYRQSIGLFNHSKLVTSCTNVGFRNFTCIVMFILFLLLILSGDIELNPGPFTKLKTLTACHINIRGLNEFKIRDLKSTICSEYDVITLSETFLSNKSSVDIELPGFHNAIRRDRPTFGGGLAVYVRENISFRRKIEFECKDIENVWLEVSTVDGKLLICNTYRPPNYQEYWHIFETNIENVKSDSHTKHILIMGDLNADFETVNGNHLCDVCLNHNLDYHIKQPTRITDRSATCLDQIITNFPNYVINTIVDPPVSSNDHCTVGLEMNFKIINDLPYHRQIWLYKDGDYEGFRKALLNYNWDECFTNLDVDNACLKWTETVLNIARSFIPNKVVLIRPNDSPWFNNELRRLLRKMKRLFKKARSTLNADHWDQYKTIKVEFQNKLAMAESNYFKNKNESLGSSKNTKQWWKTVNEILGRGKNDSYPPIFNEQNNSYESDNSKKANMFNDFFLSHNNIDDAYAELPSEDHDNINVELNEIIASEEEVHDLIQNLNPNKSTGSDGISPRLLKAAGVSIVPSLTRLINLSLSLNRVPDMWKNANIIPLHKKEDKDKLNNYRPVSILPVPSKILERIIFKHVYNFFHEHNLLTNHQSGFRPSDSTINQLAYLYHTFSEALDKKKEIRIVFCDISKAFDKVWHAGIIYKLKRAGIKGNLLNWFKDYLTNRKQRVIIRGQSSEWGVINAGVPQGSVLGPLLFLVYINDIVDVVNGGIKLFADDTVLHITVDDNNAAADSLNDDLHNIMLWAQQWLVSFSPDKTKAMCITLKTNSKATDIPLYFNNTPLKEVKEHKHLGMILTDKLKWSSHIDCIINSLSKLYDVFLKLKYKLNRRTLETIYVSFVRPKLEYGGILFDDCTDMDKIRLENVQLNFARCVTGAKRGTSHNLIYEEISWQPLSERRKENKLKFMQKIVHKSAPEYLSDLLPQPIQDNPYNLRRNQDIRQFHFRTSKFQNSLFPDCIKLWNELPADVRSIPEKDLFKEKISKSFKRNALYGCLDRGLGLIHSQFRMHCSNLNAHLFNLHVVDSPNCFCSFKNEDCYHYFFDCPMYNVERMHLFDEVQKLCDVKLNTILYGNENLSLKDNIEIFRCVERFIMETGRFANNV